MIREAGDIGWDSRNTTPREGLVLLALSPVSSLARRVWFGRLICASASVFSAVPAVETGNASSGAFIGLLGCMHVLAGR